MAHTLDVEGIDIARVLRRCGLTEADLPPEDGDWVHVSLLERLIHATLEETGDLAFGLVAGKSLALTRFAVMTPLAIFSPCLRQLFEDVHRFTPLLFDEPECTLHDTQAELVQVLMHPLLQDGLAGRYRQDFLVTSVLQMLRFAGLGNDDLLAIEIPRACEPELRSRYESCWGPRVRFDQKACRVVFARAHLDRPLPGHDRAAYIAARTRAETALTAHLHRIDTAEKVRQWLLAAFPLQPTMGDAARHVALSERTLRRNLADLGTSYQELVQECLFLQARSLLADEQASIKQVAHALGFSSVAAFHRSFKRWTDTTPTRWREMRLSP